MSTPAAANGAMTTVPAPSPTTAQPAPAVGLTLPSLTGMRWMAALMVFGLHLRNFGYFPGPLRILHRAHLVHGQRVDESCHVWDSAGHLVAHGTQLAGIRLG